MKLPVLIALIVGQTLAATADDNGFTSMFNGRDISAWTTTGNWFANERGELEIKPRKGEKGWQRYDAYLCSRQEYRNFVFDFEYQHPPGGNSGFFFRVADKADPVTSGFEVQINDVHGKTRKLTAHDCGGVIQTAAPTSNAAKPAGEWNRMVVSMIDDDLKVRLNGTTVVDINLKQAAKKPLPDKGYISLQDHGLNLVFRNLKLKVLD